MKKWFRNKEIYRHRSYDFRKGKNNNKKILIVIGILILIAFIIAKDIGGIRTLIEEKINSFNFSNSELNLVLLEGDSMMYPCSFIGNEKVNVCKYRCGIENMEYSKYDCINNALNCYCKK